MDPRRGANPSQARRARSPKGWARSAAVALALAWVAASVGCQLQKRVESAAPAEECEVRGITSVYSLGRLETRLPSSIPLHGVVIAGRQSLERRGYTIRSFGVTGDEGHVRARGGAGGETVRITARNELEETRVRVHVGALGDRDISISVMEDVLRRLGF